MNSDIRAETAIPCKNRKAEEMRGESQPVYDQQNVCPKSEKSLSTDGWCKKYH